VKEPSFVPTFISVPMVVQRALESSLSNPQTMLVMQFNNSMATIGRAVLSKSVRIDLLVTFLQEVAADSAVLVEVLGVGSQDVVALVSEVVADLAVDSVVVVEASPVDMVELLEVAALRTAQAALRLLQILSPTTLLQAPREARSSMFAT
jgi:hypothetical protein